MFMTVRITTPRRMKVADGVAYVLVVPIEPIDPEDDERVTLAEHLV
jgi:hypothetical protein